MVMLNLIFNSQFRVLIVREGNTSGHHFRQGVTYFECSNYIGICAARRIRHLCSTTNVYQVLAIWILGLIYTGYRFPKYYLFRNLRYS